MNSNRGVMLMPSLSSSRSAAHGPLRAVPSIMTKPCRAVTPHLDGYNFLPFFRGKAKKAPRETIYYFSQGGELNAVRWNDWKIHFATVEGHIATGTGAVPGWPVIVNLRADPYEKMSHESVSYI